jgi:hypothetical protein
VVLYHHFRVHDTCGAWYFWLLGNKGNPEALKNFTTMIGIRMQLCTNRYSKSGIDTVQTRPYKIYTMNGVKRSVSQPMDHFITKFVQKNMHLCNTIVGKACTYLAVSFDSIGYQEYYTMLYKVLGLERTT